MRGDLRAVLTAVLTDPEAQSFAAEDGRLKNPVLHMIGLGRALGAQIGDPNQYMVFNNLSQRVLTPTTVFETPLRLRRCLGTRISMDLSFRSIRRRWRSGEQTSFYGLLNGQFGPAFATI